LPTPIRALVVIGTRPEAVKLAPLVLELRRFPERFQVRVAVTAQHREIMDEVLSAFEIIPEHDLNVMAAQQTPAGVAAKVLTGIEEILAQQPTDLLLVEGDTTSCLAASLAAFYSKVAVGHVEAGLRTYDRWQPFPEEINRRLVAGVADLHFAPTNAARENLAREAIPQEAIFVTGNTVIDALKEIQDRLPPLPTDLQSLVGQGRMLLVTAHRRENWGEPLREICLALRDLAAAFPDVRVVYASHPHPEVQRAVREVLTGIDRVAVVNFPKYAHFVSLMKQAYLVLTDSGGVQEEAPALGKPVLVLRATTERPEGIAAGVALLCGTKREDIVSQASRLLSDSRAYQQMAHVANPYGDGNASARIRQAVEYHFGLSTTRPTEFGSPMNV
jgi:UDP-N-acetylglucosamine 2-epimerase (non-hydrolysing)